MALRGAALRVGRPVQHAEVGRDALIGDADVAYGAVAEQGNDPRLGGRGHDAGVIEGRADHAVATRPQQVR